MEEEFDIFVAMFFVDKENDTTTITIEQDGYEASCTKPNGEDAIIVENG